MASARMVGSIDGWMDGMADETGGGDKDGPKLTVIEGGGEPTKRRRRKRRPLTAKQEAFLAALIRGSNQADAYREAYDCEGGEGRKAMGSHAIHCEASLLAGHPEVTARLLAAQASIERSALSSALTRRRWIVERLEHEARSAESDAARVRALELLGKDSEVQMWQDHVIQTQTAEASPDDVRRELEARLTALLADG